MLRCVSFVTNDAARFFQHLGSLLDVTMYEWYVDDVDLNYIFFREGQYSGAEFKDALSSLSNLSFARIRWYPQKATIYPIDDYRDYDESKCDGLLLFYDGGYRGLFPSDPGQTFLRQTSKSMFSFCTDLEVF